MSVYFRCDHPRTEENTSWIRPKPTGKAYARCKICLHLDAVRRYQASRAAPFARKWPSVYRCRHHPDGGHGVCKICDAEVAKIRKKSKKQHMDALDILQSWRAT